jgi:hypothetical protein
MEISSKQLLGKMEELVGKAKQATSEEKLKGYIFAIQALCEVMVNEESSPLPSLPVSNNVKPISPVGAVSSVPMSKPAPIDGANGDSIFDF